MRVITRLFSPRAYVAPPWLQVSYDIQLFRLYTDQRRWFQHRIERRNACQSVAHGVFLRLGGHQPDWYCLARRAPALKHRFQRYTEVSQYRGDVGNDAGPI